jgi:hypothetical protein
MEDIVRLTAFFGLFLCVVFPLSLKANGELQPHRAFYTVTMMSRPDPRSSVTDIRGTMMIELSKVCDGWVVQQKSETRLYQNDGSVEHVRWGYVTYEAADGSLFKFKTYRKTNDELVEDIQGKALKKEDKIVVEYKKPHNKTLTMPEGTLLPAQHILALLKAAQEDVKMFSRIVFDGSSDQGASEMNTFIGAKKVMAGNPATETAHQFANQPFWPIRFAVHGLEKTDYEPDYITTQDLLPNGIIKQYDIDYGGIKIHGVLDRIELLSESGC